MLVQNRADILFKDWSCNFIQHVKNDAHRCFLSTVPPNNTNLYMTELVTDGEPVEVNCSAESFPPPTFTLARYSKSNSQTPFWSLRILDNSYKFEANSTNAGFYTCKASNSEGNQWSSKKQLVVKCKQLSDACLSHIYVTSNTIIFW